jgi:hypothetical protein
LQQFLRDNAVAHAANSQQKILSGNRNTKTRKLAMPVQSCLNHSLKDLHHRHHTSIATHLREWKPYNKCKLLPAYTQ